MNKKALSFISLFLFGCTLGPDYKRPDTVSDQEIKDSLSIIENNDTSIDANWYQAFGDQRLNSLIEQSLTDSPNVKIALEKLRQARLNLDIQGVQYYPTLDLSAGYTKVKPSKNTTFAFKESYYQAGLDVSWELDIWGAGRRATENARALAEAAAADLDNVRISLKAEVINNYISLRQAQEQLRLLYKTLNLQKKITLLAKDKADSGLISQSDLSQIQYSEETIKSQIPDLETAVSTYKNNLTLLSGKLPEQLNSLLDDTSNNIIRKAYRYDLKALYEIPAGTIRVRPDVRQAEQNLIAQNALIGKATAALYPNISLNALFGFQADHLPKLPNHKSDTFSLTPGLTLPLFHWGALMNQVKLEKSATQQASYVYQETVLNAATEIKNAMISVSRQAEKNATTRQALSKMEDISALTLAQYESGLISLSQALSVLQNLTKAQTDLAAGNGAVYQAIVGFYKALGV